jgi:hypothetical protein
MIKLVLPISLVVFMVILVAAFSMKKKCKCGECSKCNLFSFDHFFKKKETFASMVSEVPSFYTISTDFPKLTNKKYASADYWL